MWFWRRTSFVRGGSLIEDWYEKFAEHPFRLDPATMRRDDTPPDYRAFRESMINLLMHQDYADHSRTAVIRHYRDQTVFWNPGDAFAADPHLLEPGEREVRNPRIVLAFRRIGLSEHAGWGAARRVPELAAVGVRTAPYRERQAPQELRARPDEGGFALRLAARLAAGVSASASWTRKRARWPSLVESRTSGCGRSRP